jgi:hypothetical protein
VGRRRRRRGTSNRTRRVEPKNRLRSIVESTLFQVLAVVGTVLGILSYFGLDAGSDGGASYDAVVASQGDTVSDGEFRTRLGELCDIRRRSAERFAKDYTTPGRGKNAAPDFAADLDQFNDALGRLRPSPGREQVLSRIIASEDAYAHSFHAATLARDRGSNPEVEYELAQLALRDAETEYRRLGSSKCLGRSSQDLVALKVRIDTDRLKAEGLDVRDVSASVLLFSHCLRHPAPAEGALLPRQYDVVVDDAAERARANPADKVTVVINEPESLDQRPVRVESVVSGTVSRREEMRLLARFFLICGDTRLAHRILQKSDTPNPLSAGQSSDLSQELADWIEARARIVPRLETAIDRTRRWADSGAGGSGNGARRAQFAWITVVLIADSELAAIETEPARSLATALSRAVHEAQAGVTHMRAAYLRGSGQNTTQDYDAGLTQYHGGLDALEAERRELRGVLCGPNGRPRLCPSP